MADLNDGNGMRPVNARCSTAPTARAALAFILQ